MNSTLATELCLLKCLTTLYKTLHKGVVHKLRNRGEHVILDIDKFDSFSTEEGSSSAFDDE